MKEEGKGCVEEDLEEEREEDSAAGALRGDPVSLEFLTERTLIDVKSTLSSTRLEGSGGELDPLFGPAILAH